MPFLSVPGFLGREIIQVRMREDGGGLFTLDLDGISDAFQAGGHLFIFCDPYNPLGRVFARPEMTVLSEAVDQHGGRVFADEIHGALVYPGTRHVPYASTSVSPRRTRLPPRPRRRGGTCPGSSAPR